MPKHRPRGVDLRVVGGVTLGVMKPETLERELVIIAQAIVGAEPGGEMVAARARASILREAAGPKLALQGWLAIELKERMLSGRLPRERLLHEMCEAALDRWLGKAKQTVDVGVDQEFIQLLQAYREARFAPIDIIEDKSTIDVLLSSPIPPIVPPSPEETIVVVPGEEGEGELLPPASIPRAPLQADISNNKQSV